MTTTITPAELTTPLTSAPTSRHAADAESGDPMTASLLNVADALARLDHAVPDETAYSIDWTGGTLTLWFDHGHQRTALAVLTALDAFTTARITNDRWAGVWTGLLRGVPVRVVLIAADAFALPQPA